MLVNPHLLPPSPPYESISCDGCIFPLRSCFWPRCRHFPCPPWCICCGNNLDCLPFLLWSTFAFQAALPSDTSNQQHAAFVCIPACVPPGHHSSEKPLAHIPGILSFSLLSTLHQVSKFIVLVCARFTFFLLYVGVRRLPAQNLLMALGVQTHAFKQGFLVFIPRSFLKKTNFALWEGEHQYFSLRPCSDASWSRPVDVLGDIFLFSVQLCIYTNPLEPLLLVK